MNIALGIAEGIAIVWSSMVLFDYLSYTIKSAPKQSFFNRTHWYLATVISGSIIGWHFLT